MSWSDARIYFALGVLAVLASALEVTGAFGDTAGTPGPNWIFYLAVPQSFGMYIRERRRDTNR